MADGDRLRVRAPKGAVSDEDRLALRTCKDALLKQLVAEARIVELSLQDFGRQEYGIEVSVPWLDVTLWFVPGPHSIDPLLQRGVRRGRIWTARELIDFGNATRDDIRSLVRLKAAFGAEIVSVESDGARNG